MALYKLSDLLNTLITKGGSDLHLKVGREPLFRIDGVLNPHESGGKLQHTDVLELLKELLNDNQRKKFEERNELDLAYTLGETARFRVNVFRQRGLPSVVMRIIPTKILTLDELGAPPILKDISLYQRGMVLITGITGSGKSTTLAAMLEYVNENEPRHIVTIEDPLEFVHKDKKAHFSQREVGLDTESFTLALKYVLRQDPDVVLIGEMRDTETVRAAVAAAETGHLVFATLHTTDAPQTIDRILDFFPSDQQNQVRIQLSQVLRAVISQRLVQKSGGKGRVAAMEIMVVTPTVKGLIFEDKVKLVRDYIKDGAKYGMQTFDQHLVQYVKAGVISTEDALAEAVSPNDVELALKGIASTGSGAQASVGGMSDMLRRQAIDEMMGKANDAIKRGDADQAVAHLKKLLESVPDYPPAVEKLKELQSKVGRAENEQQVKMLVKQGLNYFQSDKIPEAIAEWEKAERLEPANAQIKAYLKGARERIGALGEARKLMTDATAAYQAGDFEKAVAGFQETLKKDPYNKEAQAYLKDAQDRLQKASVSAQLNQAITNGNTLYQQGQILDALCEWKRGLDLAPGAPELAEIAKRVEEIKQAYVEQATAGFPAENPMGNHWKQSFLQAVEAYAGLDFPQAISIWGNILASVPDHPRVGQAHARAKVRLKEVVAQNLAAARSAMSSGQLAQAVRAIQTCMRYEPNDAEVKGTYEKLRPALTEEINKHSQTALKLMTSNQFREAITEWQAVLELDPANENVKKKLDDCRQRQEKLEQILSKIQR